MKFSVLLILLSGLFLNMEKNKSIAQVYGDLSFSPDGVNLVFREKRKDTGVNGLGFLNILTGEHLFVEADSNLGQLAYPAYSPDGQYIVATAIGDNDHSNLVLLSASGKYLRKLTDGNGCRTSPSFSFDGKKILFAYSALPETASVRKCVDQDVYELDLTKGEVRQLTDFKFYHLLSPQLMPGGRQIAFSGQGPRQPINNQQYEELFGKNFVFVLALDNQELVPIVRGYPYSTKPSVSENGDLFFVAVSNQLDRARGPWNYDLFSLSKGQTTRLTSLNSSILDHTVSSNGKKVAFLADLKRSGIYTMMIMNSDGSGLRSLGLAGKAN